MHIFGEAISVLLWQISQSSNTSKASLSWKVKNFRMVNILCFAYSRVTSYLVSNSLLYYADSKWHVEIRVLILSIFYCYHKEIGEVAFHKATVAFYTSGGLITVGEQGMHWQQHAKVSFCRKYVICDKVMASLIKKIRPNLAFLSI